MRFLRPLMNDFVLAREYGPSGPYPGAVMLHLNVREVEGVCLASVPVRGVLDGKWLQGRLVEGYRPDVGQLYAVAGMLWSSLGPKFGELKMRLETWPALVELDLSAAFLDPRS